MKERIYYAINESGARLAKNMSSFNDYRTGSRTADYQAQVNEAYEAADQVATKKPDQAETAYKLAERYSRLLANNINKDISISCRCPSVMISGPANFPVRKKEKQIAAWDKNYSERKYIDELLSKLRNMMYGPNVIKSGDQNAIEKLKDKLAKLEQNQEYMKQVNAFYRKHKTLEGCSLLSPEDQAKLTEAMAQSWHMEDKPFVTYQTSNNNQNINATRKRIESLEAAKQKPAETEENENYKVVENSEIMRLQIIFEGKPEPEVRDILKSNGFKWAPSQNAWQRQLTPNALYSKKLVIAKLDTFYNIGEVESVNY